MSQPENADILHTSSQKRLTAAFVFPVLLHDKPMDWYELQAEPSSLPILRLCKPDSPVPLFPLNNSSGYVVPVLHRSPLQSRWSTFRPTPAALFHHLVRIQNEVASATPSDNRRYWNPHGLSAITALQNRFPESGTSMFPAKKLPADLQMGFDILCFFLLTSSS